MHVHNKFYSHSLFSNHKVIYRSTSTVDYKGLALDKFLLPWKFLAFLKLNLYGINSQIRRYSRIVNFHLKLRRSYHLEMEVLLSSNVSQANQHNSLIQISIR